MANVLSKYVPGLQATAEVTGGSVDNLKLIGTGKSEVGFSMVDSAWDAAHGQDKFKDGKVNVRTLMVLYPNRMQIVTLEGSGIEKLSDIRGKRVSTGSPGSGVEVVTLRVLEAMGLDPKKDLKQERLSVAESANAIKDRKIDAFFWVGGIPTAGVTDLAATPGVKIKLIDHADAVPVMAAKYGNLYSKGVIKAGSYPGQDKDNPNADVWNILVTDEKMSNDFAYTVVKTIFDKKPELVAVHREAESFVLATQKKENSPIPFHPGAIKYFKEKGLSF
jgi:TRAP transporter TAXI family solute receptor